MTDSMRLAGRVAVVTETARGIGFARATRFTAERDTVVWPTFDAENGARS